MSVGRLAEQFRDDVHAAAAPAPAEARPESSGWQFQLPPDRTVVYRRQAGHSDPDRTGPRRRTAARILRVAGSEHGPHRGLIGRAAGGGLFAAGPARRKRASRGGHLRPRLPLCQDARQEETMMSDHKCQRRRGGHDHGDRLPRRGDRDLRAVAEDGGPGAGDGRCPAPPRAGPLAGGIGHRAGRRPAGRGCPLQRRNVDAARRRSCPTAGWCALRSRPRGASPLPAWSASRPAIPTILSTDAGILRKLWSRYTDNNLGTVRIFVRRQMGLSPSGT